MEINLGLVPFIFYFRPRFRMNIEKHMFTDITANLYGVFIFRNGAQYRTFFYIVQTNIMFSTWSFPRQIGERQDRKERINSQGTNNYAFNVSN